MAGKPAIRLSGPASHQPLAGSIRRPNAWDIIIYNDASPHLILGRGAAAFKKNAAFNEIPRLYLEINE